MKIAVLGYIVRGPLGGLVRHHFQYVLGLKALGHEVLFLEDSDDFPGCYNPDTSAVTENPDYGKSVAEQNKGFSQVIETGRGLFAFSSLSEAIEVVYEINSDYPKHCPYACDITEEYFLSDKVLTCMLNLAA